MKKLTISQKMRWIAGLIYGLLAVYQMFICRELLGGANLTNATFSWLYAMALIFVASGMCVWMFAGKDVFSSNVQRGVVAATTMFCIFELMTYRDQTTLINYTLYTVFPSLYDSLFWQYAFMMIRLLLMILGAFFLTSNRTELDFTSDKNEEEESEEDEDSALNEENIKRDLEAKIGDEVIVEEVIVETILESEDKK